MAGIQDRREVEGFVRKARWRIGYVRAVRGGARALFGVACAGVFVVLAERLLAFLIPWEIAVAFGAGVVALVGIGILLFGRPDGLTAAVEVDTGAGWKERVSSLVALPEVRSPMERALLTDVRERLGSKKLTRILPHRPPRELKWLPVPAALLVGATFLPQYDLLGLRAARQAQMKKQEELRRLVEKLTAVRNKMKQGTAGRKQWRHGERIREAIRKLEEVRNELRNPAADRKEALARLAEAKEKFRNAAKELGATKVMADKLRRGLERNRDAGEGGNIERMLREGRFGEAAKELKELSRKMEKGELPNEERERLLKEMEALTKKIDGVGDLEDLEQALSKAAKAFQSDNPVEMEDLERMLEDWEEGLSDLEALEEILGELEKLEEELARDEGG